MFDAGDWIKSWSDVGDAAVSAFIFYFLIVVMVRVVGKRMTAQLNNFDWIINITVGSLIASAILLDSVPAARAIAAIVVLALLQVGLTFLVQRSSGFSRLVKVQPTLLVHRGEYLEEALRRTRVSKAEICGALREHGLTRLDDASWVVLETDGKMTVIGDSDRRLAEATAMGNVERPEGLERRKAS